ncbi:MAG: PDC sensor domain-containing protein, partial [Psychromonas sp.]
MLNLKRNIWLLFYIIVFIGSILLAIAIYDKYQQIVKESKNAQRYLTQVDQKHLNVLFTYHETIQSLIADEYINNRNFDSNKLNTLYKLNPLLLDIWVFSKEGELLRATLPGVSFPNMLKNENTRKWFQEALNSNEMVIGKPYLLQCIDKWILPIRKRVLDNNGNIVAVISTALDLSKLQDQWKKEDNQGNTIRVILSHGGFLVVDSDIKVQDAPDHYEQAYKPVYYNHKSSTYEKYSFPVRALAKQINGSLTKNANSKSVIQGSDLLDSGLQDSDLQNVHTTPSYLDKGISSEIFYTRSHNARYHFAITAEIPYYRLYQKLFTESLFASAFYLLFIIVVFMLFRWID